MKHLPLITGLKIGADVEVFLQDKATKEIVSAEGYVMGTKNEPYNFDPTNPFRAISLDNVLGEFCIPPVMSAQDFLEEIKRSLGFINQIIPETLCTVAQPAAILDDRFLQTKNALTFGCEPDYNVYLRCENKPPKASNPNLRSAGGHIHIGYDRETGVPRRMYQAIDEAIIKTMDLFLGIPSVMQEPNNDRKQLYGKAGAFRFKAYGVEYRTISNYYLANDNLTMWVCNNAMKGIEFLNGGGLDELESVSEIVQEAINTSNEVLASNLIRQFNIEMA